MSTYLITEETSLFEPSWLKKVYIKVRTYIDLLFVYETFRSQWRGEEVANDVSRRNDKASEGEGEKDS